MTNLPISNSKAEASVAFELLAEPVRRWIYAQGWGELRNVQDLAIRPVLEAAWDVVIVAATASGKTEAAFLPVCSKVIETEGPGVRVLYVAPLKALINDQFGRAESLCTAVNLPVHRWHGDVAAARKRELLDKPSGILLITPESLEAIFINHGTRVAALFAGLSYVIVDELHAFIGNERGRQLQSLLHRVELAIGRLIPRVALSATLGDLEIAKRFLRPEDPSRVLPLVDDADGATIKLLARGYRTAAPAPASSGDAIDDAEEQATTELTSEDDLAIAAHLYKTLRGSKNLVFANAKSQVEHFADMLRRRCESEKVPNEFVAHHGSLAKEFRESAESSLRDDTRPVTVVCTSTLEMGIDIGAVSSVAQLGSPTSVSSTRQRLGRSGRRDEPAVLRFYVREQAIRSDTDIEDTLRSHIVQTIAVVTLMSSRWCEPPTEGALHLSTLIQQLLSILAERGGATARELHAILCGAGPFREVSKGSFVALLRQLAARDVVSQTHDDTVVLGLTGERMVNHYTFFAAFNAPEEYRLIGEGKVLGSLPITTAVIPGMFLVFVGRRWRVVGVDAEKKVIDLAPAKGGRLPIFQSTPGMVHDRVREEMRGVLASFEVPPYLDARAKDLLHEGRDNFVRYGLAASDIVRLGSAVVLFPWAGDRVMNTLAVALRAAKLDCSISEGRIALRISGPDASIVDRLNELARSEPPDARALASTIAIKVREKHDWLLSAPLLDEEYAARDLDPAAAWRVLRRMVSPLTNSP